MSNILVSQQLSLPVMPESQSSQENSGMSGADTSMPSNLGPRVDLEPLSRSPSINQLPMSSMQPHSVNSYSAYDISVRPQIPSNLIMQSQLMPNNLAQRQSAMPNREAGQRHILQPSSVQMNLSMSGKRKATTVLLPDHHISHKMSAPNRRGAQGGSLAKPSGAMSATMSDSLKTGASAKKVVPPEPIKNKSQSTASKKNGQPQVSSKPSTESSESVRAKLRESLASALALVSQKQENSPDENKKTENEGVAISEKEIGVDNSTSSNGAVSLEPAKPEVAPSISAATSTDGCRDTDVISHSVLSNDSHEEANNTWNYIEPEFQNNPVLSGEDVSFGNGFFFRDELLQGNGLTWEADFGQHIPDVYQHALEVKQVEQSEKPELMQEELDKHEEEQTLRSPESVAFDIESELFKLFGGVNRKYKEKGRSLLFNLKDPNNPELRERVMSGEIPPNRLCSMTTEELASRELSEWRIAKAEELDHLKVLPNADPNMRRLVKKTHKGEYQVDFEVDTGAVEEIPSGTNMPSRPESKTKGTKVRTTPKKKTKKEQVGQCDFTMLSDGADIQGLMVDDVRDLPPILSLDEFMESLDKEPPFEDLPVETIHEMDEDLELVSKCESPVKPSEDPVEETSQRSNSMSPVRPIEHPVEKTSPKTESPVRPLEHSVQTSSPQSKSMSPVQPSKLSVEVPLQKTNEQPSDSSKSNDKVKSASPTELDTSKVVNLPKGERVWEGSLQLTVSSIAKFVAFYKSGEKARTKEWPECFDIKGRVKLEAFDQFVQALPMSRSRAIMVTQFVLKEGSSDSECASLQEMTESYVSDQRLGFAEPASGVELYLCPPGTKSVDVIMKHLPKTFTEKLNDVDNGLIGLVVWRKVQPITPPTISPKSSSHHHKEMTKKFGDQNDMKRNVGFPVRHAPPPPVRSHPQPVEDNDDDAPPGFGPPGQNRRDDDDLPEFNFSGSSNASASRISVQNSHVSPHVPIHKVDKMRELIQKYGQNGDNSISGTIPMQPWNDDDDDIPEWQPQPLQLPAHANTPALRPAMANQLQQQLLNNTVRPPVAQQIQPLQQPLNISQQGTWWPYGPTNSVGNQSMLGRDWRPNRGY